MLVLRYGISNFRKLINDLISDSAFKSKAEELSAIFRDNQVTKLWSYSCRMSSLPLNSILPRSIHWTAPSTTPST